MALVSRLLAHLPHARGDEPKYSLDEIRMMYICPTHVGMNRPAAPCDNGAGNLPHARGDEPKSFYGKTQAEAICPTHVGMNRSSHSITGLNETICPTHVGMNRREIHLC